MYFSYLQQILEEKIDDDKEIDYYNCTCGLILKCYNAEKDDSPFHENKSIKCTSCDYNFSENDILYKCTNNNINCIIKCKYCYFFILENKNNNLILKKEFKNLFVNLFNNKKYNKILINMKKYFIKPNYIKLFKKNNKLLQKYNATLLNIGNPNNNIYVYKVTNNDHVIHSTKYM